MLLIQQKLNNLLYGKQYYNSYFERCVTKYKKIDNYISLYDTFFKPHKLVTTSEDINHTSKIPFGISIGKAKKHINVPFRHIRNPNLCDIIFYKTRIGDFKIIVELHFFKKKLVFFKYIFHTTLEKSNILNKVLSKYQLTKSKFNLRNSLITNNEDYFIKIENEVSLSMYYFTPKLNFYDFLVQKQHQRALNKLAKENYHLEKLLDRI